MRSEKAWVWLTAGVLALGLNGAYQDGQFAWAHHLADRSAAFVQQAQDQSCRFLAMAELMLGHDHATIARAQDRLAQMQDRLSRQQMDRMQRQIEAAQFKIARAQRMVMVQQDEPCTHSHRFMVQVPEVNVPAVDVSEFMSDVNVPSIRIPEINIPQVKIPRVDIPNVKIPEVRVPSMRVRVDEDNNGSI